MEFTRTAEGLQQKDIGGHSYEFSKWGAEEATDTLLDIATIVGKPLAAAAGRLDVDAAMERRLELPTDAISTIIEQLTGQVGLHKKLCMGLIKKLATRGVLCDGRAINFDSHYQDALPHLLDVVAAALEVQFGNFFGGALGAFRLRRTPTPPASRAPESTPSSGGPS